MLELNIYAALQAILGKFQKWWLKLLLVDNILGITEAFKADSFKEKINLGAGVAYEFN